MASNGAPTNSALVPVVQAFQTTTQTQADAKSKKAAFEYLESFQRSPESWSLIFEMLQSTTIDASIQMFAATSLKGKVIHDLHQVPQDSLLPLRDSIFGLLKRFQDGPKPIRTQLCISLAHVALQLTEWKDVLPMIMDTFGVSEQSGISLILEFLKVLAEEVLDGRKINLTEDELYSRTKELMEKNAAVVLQFLSDYAVASPFASRDPLFMACVQSWAREIPLSQIADSPLLGTIFRALETPEAFEAAVECLLFLTQETREVDEYLDVIEIMFTQIMALRPKLSAAAGEDDYDTFKGISKLFAETGEHWVILLVRRPEAFLPLVETVLEVTSLDKEKEAIRYTFNFWNELKLYLVLEKYMEARMQFAHIFSSLVDNMIVHLRYPTPEDPNSTDLFEGDREQEERFRNYRHEMGNILKDCCEVLGVTECLTKPYKLIQEWAVTNLSQATESNVPKWQELEAPIFAVRAMGHIVPSDENAMLPQLIPLILQIPDQEKLRYQVILTVGRYTEWTAKHPATLQPQLDYIMAGFSHSSKEVVRAATLSFRFFCVDCADHLKGYWTQLHQFFVSVIHTLPDVAQQEICEGISAILTKQPVEKLYEDIKMCCDPILQKVVEIAKSSPDKAAQYAISDKVNLVTTFFQNVTPYIDPSLPHPIVQYCQEILPILGALAESFQDFVPILERVCRCWRYMVLSYRSAMAPVLPELAPRLASGFNATNQGCFLWATDSIVREFSEGAEGVDAGITDSVIPFFEQQTQTFITVLGELPPDELPSLIEDYFRLAQDVLMFHPHRAILSNQMPTILTAATKSLEILKHEVLLAILHFIRDFIAYSHESSPTSSYGDTNPIANPPEIQNGVKAMLVDQGEGLVQRLLYGMMYSFPEDCVPDASGAILDLVHVLPTHVPQWVGNVLVQLPAGSIRPQEREKLVNGIQSKIQSNEVRKIRPLLQDFTNSYRRRNVMRMDMMNKFPK